MVKDTESIHKYTYHVKRNDRIFFQHLSWHAGELYGVPGRIADFQLSDQYIAVNWVSEITLSFGEAMAKHLQLTECDEAWRHGVELKDYSDRCAALERLRKAPIKAVFRFAAKGRKFLSRSLGMPEPSSSKWFVFARTNRNGRFKDVVLLDVERGRKHLSLYRIAFLKEMVVGRRPRGYWIREIIHAQAGHSPAVRTHTYISDVRLLFSEKKKPSNRSRA